MGQDAEMGDHIAQQFKSFGHLKCDRMETPKTHKQLTTSLINRDTKIRDTKDTKQIELSPFVSHIT